MKVHISTADLPFLEASYIDTTGMAHIKIVEARLEELDIQQTKGQTGPNWKHLMPFGTQM
jgi:hypothetical protein